MRATVIWWSAASGAILGIFIDAILIGVALFFAAVVPSRDFPRWVLVLAGTVLAGVLLGMTLLGYLEGRLKAA